MAIFSVTCLVIIILAIQHLLNWYFRKLADVSLIPLSIICILVGTIITTVCVVHITLWLYPIISK
jgi:hypothetical protein